MNTFLKLKLAFTTLLITSLSLSTSVAESPNFTIATYNLQNWGKTNRMIDGEFQRDAMKPMNEKQAVISIIKELDADVLVLQEVIIGDGESNVKDLRAHIENAGMDYPYAIFSTGSDSRIGILLLSKHPFLEAHVLNEDKFTLRRADRARETLRVSRGFPHAAIEPIPGKRIDILGVHFKSKLPKPEFDDPSNCEKGDLNIRRQEALVARGHALRLRRENPNSRIIILGDFNDHTRHNNEPDGPVEIIIKRGDAILPLTVVDIFDVQGDQWTHFFDAQKTYDRIDMVIVDSLLANEFLPEHSFVYREKEGSPRWNVASDHRAVRAAFKIQ